MTDHVFSRTNRSDLTDRKLQYLQHMTAPLDGMWETFVDSADHYCIQCSGQVIGHCVVNDSGKVLQFDVATPHDAVPIFGQMLSEIDVSGAFVSTGEPQYLSLCMDRQKSVSVNAFMYQSQEDLAIEDPSFPTDTQFLIIEMARLNNAVDFGINTLGADPVWLTEYFTERIRGNELYGLWRGSSLIATGECRPSQTQKPYVDLGMMVSKDHRGKGIGTSILQKLMLDCREQGWIAICSTERDNVAAQKAISRSGFTSQHRVLEVAF